MQVQHKNEKIAHDLYVEKYAVYARNVLKVSALLDAVGNYRLESSIAPRYVTTRLRDRPIYENLRFCLERVGKRNMRW